MVARQSLCNVPLHTTIYTSGRAGHRTLLQMQNRHDEPIVDDEKLGNQRYENRRARREVKGKAIPYFPGVNSHTHAMNGISAISTNL